MEVLLSVVAEAVVTAGIGRLQFDLIDQFAAPGCGQSGTRELSPSPLGQQQVLDRRGIVGRQFQGTGDGPEQLGWPVELGQADQATQVDAGLERPLPEAEVELACLGSQRIKRLFQCGTPSPTTQGQRGGAMVRQDDQLPPLVAADMLGQHLTLVEHADRVA